MIQVGNVPMCITALELKAKHYNLKKEKVMICMYVIFNEKTSWDWKQKALQGTFADVNGEVENEENHEKFVESSPQEVTPPAALSHKQPDLYHQVQLQLE